MLLSRTLLIAALLASVTPAQAGYTFRQSVQGLKKELNCSWEAKEQLWTATGTARFTVPEEFRAMTVTVVGGGGGGETMSGDGGVSGGGGGGTILERPIAPTPGETVTVTVGAGGDGGTEYSTDGGASAFGGYALAYGGKAGGVGSGTDGGPNSYRGYDDVHHSYDGHPYYSGGQSYYARTVGNGYGSGGGGSRNLGSDGRAGMVQLKWEACVPFP